MQHQRSPAFQDLRTTNTENNMKVILNVFAFATIITVANCENVTETESFSIAITPKMFNWTYEEFDKQYSYHASIVDKPDLPQWLHYTYSIRHQSGFIYGTPPYKQDNLLIQIVALNRQNYETRQIVIPLHIIKKENIATYQVQLKIDNLNVEDVLDPYRMERLKDVFRKKLWKESAHDLHATFIASAIELGARLPLKPNEGEGVVLKLGSFKAYSSELLQLQEEVRPLLKLASCPRDFKRTTVERLFRDVGFNLDWCTFRLVESAHPSIKKNERKFNSISPKDLRNKLENKTDSKIADEHANLMNEKHRWLPPAKYEVPHRSYIHEFTFTIIVPTLVMIFLVSVLSMILCFHHEGMEDIESNNFFNNIFHICEEYAENKRSARNVVSDGKVEISQYNSDASAVTETNPNNSAPNLQTCLNDNVSNKSNTGVSPNNSISKNPSPKSNPNLIIDYNRPQPPPYLGSNTNTLILRQKPNIGNEDYTMKRNQARTLEESLQMLNEANILNPGYCLDNNLYQDRIVLGDEMLDDGVEANATDEDYVPIKQDMRRSIGLRNGKVNNGGIIKNNDHF
ncbi:sarcoglycan alpha isoform X2 [Arctopsyche grandis]|uniref:sarcoglycan alpha isoform X2 n=1 Tax=Arctopsyche grandis TaxID=121162 RepID=UPI00406D63A8